MRLEEMYKKSITRDIKGVIKVGQDDQVNVKTELEEYVVTDELLTHFENFFKAYRRGVENNTDKMGVWISGFFGSGKSHFLKILSYALENKKVNDKTTFDYFTDKIADSRIIQNMEFASGLTTDVMLFNIDAKSTSAGKNNKEAILEVFNNVFNEMQGFSGITPWLADLERFLSEKGKYEDFKINFEELYGESWEKSREDTIFIADEIVIAYVKTLGGNEEYIRNWLENPEQKFNLNIELFAKRINEYLGKKAANHQVVFLVDEIGQYIGEDSKLMLNLQTIVEELGAKCFGRVWVLVTSQQDIDAVAQQVKGNDFSKILGRFDTRLSLSSNNVDEVIRKRLLEKNDLAEKTLCDLFIQHQSILKNLLTFSSDTAEMKIYKDEHEFVDFYPFIPYQFHLLQQVFNGIRTKGASGKHLSEGERSLLSAFQESAIYMKDQEVGYLAPFSTFYKTIDDFLEPTVKRAISKAGKNTHLNPFDVEVLKTLFLVKYAKEVSANKENITTLMISHIDEDKLELSQKIEASLKRLIHETLIQQNGEIYDFLTNDEQDINREIKSIFIDSSEVVKKIGDIFSGDIYSESRYRYNKTYNFGLNKKIDDFFLTKMTNEIGIHVITPWCGVDYSETELKSMSGRENNLIIYLPSETTNYLNEIEEALKIESYIKKKNGTSMTDSIKDIITRKGKESLERKERAVTFLKEAVKHAKYYANMSEVSVNVKDPRERINEGLEYIVKTIFNKLIYIDKNYETERDLAQFLNEPVPVAKTVSTSNSQSEIKQYLQRQQNANHRVTVKDIINNFKQRPFGWRELDTIAELISLFKEKELSFVYNNEDLTSENRQFIDLLCKQNYNDRVIVRRRETIAPKFIKLVKDLFKDLFDISYTTDDEDHLMKQFKENLNDELNKITTLIEKCKDGQLPGYKTLTTGEKVIDELLAEKNLLNSFKLIEELEDDLLDYFEDIEEIKDFYNSNQIKLFKDGLNLVTIFEQNQHYLNDSNFIQIVESVKSITESTQPYKSIFKLHEYKDKFDQSFESQLSSKREPVVKDINKNLLSLTDYVNKIEDNESLMHNLTIEYNSLNNRLEQARSFDAIIAIQASLSGLKEKWTNKINDLIDKQNAKQNEKLTENQPPKIITKKRVPVKLNSILPKDNIIQSKEDIEKVINKIRQELEAQLKTDTELELL